MKKMKLFCIFASAILAGCATLCVLSCSEDEFDDFEDDEVYTLSRPKKTNTFEYAEGKGDDAFGDVVNGELLWHKTENTTLNFNVFYYEFSDGYYHGPFYETYDFPLEFTADVVYTIGNDNELLYGALLEWRPGYSNLDIQITNVSENTLNYRAKFTNPHYDPSVSYNPQQYYYQNGSINRY